MVKLVPAGVPLKANHVYQPVFPCEPQLGRRGLYPTVSIENSTSEIRTMMNLIVYADGAHDMVAQAETCAYQRYRGNPDTRQIGACGRALPHQERQMNSAFTLSI
jgi:aminopeptidase-like protein